MRGLAALAFAIAALLTILAFLPAQAHAAETMYSGRCGETTSWTYDEDGVLTISGTGAVVLKGYNDTYLAPHNFAVYGYGAGSGYIYLQHIAKAIVVEEGITSIEADLFKNYRLVEQVSLPSTLESIELRTFAGCSNLLTVSVAKGSKLKSIGSSAFAGCRALQTADFSAATALSSIGADVFDSDLVYCKIAKATAKKGGKLALTWNKTLGATKYVLYYKIGKASKYSKTTVKTTQKTLTKLKKGKKYKVYVEAYLGKAKLCASPVKTTAKIKG